MEYFRKMIKTIFSIILALVLLVNIAAAGDKISEDVKSRMKIGEKVPVIIMLKEQPSLKSLSKDQPSLKSLSKEDAIALRKSHATTNQKDITALLKEEKSKDNGKADKIRTFWIVNAIALDASPELIEKLEKRDDVERIEFDEELSIAEDLSVQVSPEQIANATLEINRTNATKVWELGIDGTGINVSVIDTGIDASHPDLAGRVIRWKDYINTSTTSPYDDNEHGTRVAGIVGGNGSKGYTTGVAPNVSLFGVKVINSTTGSGNDSDMISGIEWSVENGADVISMSLSIGTSLWTSSNCDSYNSAMTTAINNAVASNVTVVVAAGNTVGPGVKNPACISSTIAVGSVDSSDTIDSYSGRGAAMADHGVVAPGVNILSLLPTLWRDYGYGYYTYEPPYHAENMSGTSFATPFVSGTVALMLQAARKNGTSLTPVQIRSILQNTSIDLGEPGRDTIFGAGRINVSNATAAIASYAASTPAPTPPGSITALQNSTYAQTYINWTWTDPADAEFSKVMIYLNGTFQTNVTKGVQFYNATGLAIDTAYNLSTQTVDASGNINQTWINHTARTASSIGQNTYVQLSNGSFGIVLKGREKTINYSLTLNNTGDRSATVEARFSNVSGVFGMVSGANTTLNATSFALGIHGSTFFYLNDTNSSVFVATAPPGVTYLDAGLTVPSDQLPGDYNGTVILIFSNTI